MKILFVYDTYHPYGGGSQILSLNWFRLLNKNGIETYYLTNSLAKNSEVPFKKRMLINKLSLEINKPLPKFKIPLLIDPPILDLILKNHFEIIQFFEPSLIGLEIVFLKKFIKSKIVFYYSTLFKNGELNNSFEKTFSFLASSLQKFFIDSSDGIIFPCNWLKNLYKKELKNKKIKVVYPSIKNHFFNKDFEIKKRKPQELVTVSRLVKEKRLDILFETIKLLKDKYRLNIVGDGKDRKYYEKLVKKLGIESQVKFWGWISHRKLPNLIKRFDIFLFPSVIETFGLVQIEALASGLPLITVDNKLNREIIPTEMAIFLKEFTPQNLVKSLKNLQNNEKNYISFQERIKRNYFKLFKYSEEKSLEGLLGFYKSFKLDK